MRVRRLLASVITVGLIAPAAAIVSTSGTSASAAVATSIVPSDSTKPLIYTSSNAEYGDSLYTNVDIVGADGSSPYGGTTTLQRQLVGESTWTTISTTSGAYVSSSGLKAEGNATYRITWSGSGNWTGSSADAAVAVSRAIDVDTISGKRAGFKGKIKPAGKVKIKVTRKVGKKYKKYKTIKSNAKGRWQILLPAPRTGRINWKLKFVGDSRFKATTLKGYTY